MTKRDQEQHHRFQYGAVTYRYNIDRNFVEVDHDHSEPAYDENDFCRHYNALESVKAHSTSTISSRFSLRRIQICPARACNLKCRYCYASHTIDYSAPAIMDAAVGRRCIDFVLSKAGSRRDIVVAFVGGGEPLIGWPTIRKIVQYCRYIEQNSQRRFYFQINTNATLMNEAIRAFLVANEFRVIVSIDGFEAMHDAMRVYPDGSGSYADTVANTLALKAEFDQNEKKSRIGVRVTMSDGFCDPPAIRSALASLGFHEITISMQQKPAWQQEDKPLQDCLALMKNIHARTSQTFVDIVKKLESGVGLTPEEEGILKHFSDYPHQTTRFMIGHTCGVACNAMAIATDGRIYPCHRFLDVDEYAIGNVHNGVCHDRRTHFLSQLVTQHKTHCLSCWLWKLCQGPCPWTLSDKGGSIADIPIHFCKTTKQEAERGLWFAHEVKRHRESHKVQSNAPCSIAPASNSGTQGTSDGKNL